MGKEAEPGVPQWWGVRLSLGNVAWGLTVVGGAATELLRPPHAARNKAGREGQAGGREAFGTCCCRVGGAWVGQGVVWPRWGSLATPPTPCLPSTGKPQKAFGGALGALGFQGE